MRQLTIQILFLAFIISLASCGKNEDELNANPLIGIWEADSSQREIEFIYNNSRPNSYSTANVHGYHKYVFHNDFKCTNTSGLMIFEFDYRTTNDSIFFSDSNNYSPNKYSVNGNELVLVNQINYVFSDSLGGGQTVWRNTTKFLRK